MVYTKSDIDLINLSFCPQPGKKIARYVGLNNFDKMINKRALWLSNATYFMDKNEGEIPLQFFEKWEKDTEEHYRVYMDLKSKAFSAYISCWTDFEYEQETMWLSYGGNKDINGKRDTCGICVISNIDKLYRIIGNYQNPIFKLYKVKYIDFCDSKDIVPPFYYRELDNGIMLASRVFFAYKKKEYADEKEIRLIMFDNGNEKGKSLQIDINDFIEAIIINPHATAIESEKIKNYLSKKGLLSKVIESKIECNM